MTDISAEHDVVFILKNGSGKARPNHQPVKESEGHGATPRTVPVCWA